MGKVEISHRTGLVCFFRVLSKAVGHPVLVQPETNPQLGQSAAVFAMQAEPVGLAFQALLLEDLFERTRVSLKDAAGVQCERHIGGEVDIGSSRESVRMRVALWFSAEEINVWSQFGESFFMPPNCMGQYNQAFRIPMLLLHLRGHVMVVGH